MGMEMGKRRAQNAFAHNGVEKGREGGVSVQMAIGVP